MPPSPRDPRAAVRALRRAPVVAEVAQRTRARRSVARIRRSGLFDRAWYEDQAAAVRTPVTGDPIAHHVTVGAGAGWSPHPLFDPASYLETAPKVADLGVDPFTHYLAAGHRRGLAPHPLFDPAHLVAVHAEAADHAYGPLAWYLADPDRQVAPPTALLRPDEAPTPRAFVTLVRRVHAEHDAVPDHTGVRRTFATFDHDAGRAHVAAMAERVAALDGPPLVSVVVPTKDRVGSLPATLDAVLAQTYPHLELLVVDDGSTDGTDELLATYAARDDRVRTFHQGNAGVASARNHGLREARGDLVAYLDSDNTWVPEFLATMVGTLRTTGARAAYAASELRAEDRVEYRGRPFDRDALVERNYIDCITLVHERSLLDDVGGFDEDLRRVVDWDLLIRLSAVTELVYAPFVATSYDLWDEAGERITRTESVGYRYAVRAKHLLAATDPPAPVAGRDSLLVVARRDDPDPVADTAWTVRAHLDHADRAGRDLEVVVVDDGTSRTDALRLRLLGVALDRVRVERIADRVNLATALDLAAARASGDVLVIVDPALRLDPAPLATTADAVRAGRATAAQPVLVSDHEGTVVSSGWRTGSGGAPVQVGWQLAPHDALVTGRTDRDAVDLAACAVDTAAFRRLGGLAPVFVRTGAEIDLGRRLCAAGGTCAVVGEAVAVLDPKPYHRRWQLGPDDDRELRRRHAAGDESLGAWVEGTGTAVVGLAPAPRGAIRGPQRWTPVLGRSAGGPRRWAIKVAALDASDRETWGDWHFAVALRDALADLGEHAVVDLRRGWHRATAHLDDIDLVLRGTQGYDLPPGRVGILWVISHPGEVTRDEVAGYDQVYAASTVFAAEASSRWGRPVVPLLQATDPARFAVTPDPALATPLLFVGNSRGIARRIVADAVAAGLEPAIYGRGWDGLVPAHLVRGDHVSNHQLGRYYASAEVVLADHWDDMRDRGFVANRLFDAVAAGAAVVSDDVPGVAELFGGAVRTYRDPDELGDAVAAARAWRAARDAAATPEVAAPAAGHTFHDRARELVAWADRRGIGAVTGS